MDRSIRITFFGLVLFAALNSDAATNRLNVLLIMADDLNTRLGCYGSKEVKSPHIDELARVGVRFEHAYSHYPICNPSRAALLSGRRPGTTRVLDNNTPPRKYLPGVAFLPEYFHENGYFTARVGKIAHGPFNNHVRWDASFDPPKDKTSSRVNWLATTNDDANEPDGFSARKAVQLLETNRDKPLFIAAGFDKPHLPLVAPKKYFDLYALDAIPLPSEPKDVRKGAPWVAFTSRGGPWSNANEERQAIAAYYACISFIDAQVGVLIEGLKRLNLMDRTIIVVTSDHGFHLGEHGGLWRKSTLFEESARVPLIVWAPGITNGGAACPRVIEHVDLYPTLAELCGLPQPPGLEGRSFAPLLKEPSTASDKAAITVFVRGTVIGNIVGQSIRTEQFRYTEWDSGRRGTELYDHAVDPHEWTNLAQRAENKATVEELRTRLHETSPQPKVGISVAAKVYTSIVAASGVFAGFVFLRRRRPAS
jgi:uncharacterized sulfatase